MVRKTPKLYASEFFASMILKDIKNYEKCLRLHLR